MGVRKPNQPDLFTGRTELLFHYPGFRVHGSTFTDISMVETVLGSGLRYVELKTGQKLITGGDIHYDQESLGYIGSGAGLDSHDKEGYWNGLKLDHDWLLTGYWCFDNDPASYVEKLVESNGYHHMFYRHEPEAERFPGAAGRYAYHDGTDNNVTVAFNTNPPPAGGFDYSAIAVYAGFPDGSITYFYPEGIFSHLWLTINNINDFLPADGTQGLGAPENVPATDLPGIPQPFDLVPLLRMTPGDPRVTLRLNYSQIRSDSRIKGFVSEKLGRNIDNAREVDPIGTVANLVRNIDSHDPHGPLDSIVFNKLVNGS